MSHRNHVNRIARHREEHHVREARHDFLSHARIPAPDWTFRGSFQDLVHRAIERFEQLCTEAISLPLVPLNRRSRFRFCGRPKYEPPLQRRPARSSSRTFVHGSSAAPSLFRRSSISCFHAASHAPSVDPSTLLKSADATRRRSAIERASAFWSNAIAVDDISEKIAANVGRRTTLVDKASMEGARAQLFRRENRRLFLESPGSRRAWRLGL